MDIQFRETKALWEGALEQPAVTFRSADRVVASIGEPFQWADGELLGDNWKPPVGGARYYLVQFAFTLSPLGNAKITSTDFSLTLGRQVEKKAIVFDAFPREETVGTDDSFTLGIGPDFKFGTTDASLAKAEAKFDLGRVVPVVYVEGLQESKLCWRYSEHAKYPLKGSRRMVAIISIPDGMNTALTTLELTVDAEGRFGPFKVSTLDIDPERLRWVVGNK